MLGSAQTLVFRFVLMRLAGALRKMLGMTPRLGRLRKMLGSAQTRVLSRKLEDRVQTRALAQDGGVETRFKRSRKLGDDFGARASWVELMWPRNKSSNYRFRGLDEVLQFLLYIYKNVSHLGVWCRVMT